MNKLVSLFLAAAVAAVMVSGCQQPTDAGSDASGPKDGGTPKAESVKTPDTPVDGAAGGETKTEEGSTAGDTATGEGATAGDTKTEGKMGDGAGEGAKAEGSSEHEHKAGEKHDHEHKSGDGH
jgi:hypothetical protein